MSISGLSGSNAMMQFYNIKEEAELKSYVNKLLREFDSAGTKEAKDKVAAQLKSLASSSGASLSDIGASRASDTSIFSPKLAVAPTATAANTATHAATNTAPQATAKEATIFDGPANTAGGSLSASEAKSLADQYKSIDNHQAWTRASANQDQAMMKEIHAEFGIADGNKSVTRENIESWAKFAAQSDKVTVYDAATGEIKDGKSIQENDIVEFNSSKFGKVLMQVGGDGNLDGGDDVIISKGGQAAAEGTTQGLNKLNNNLAAATGTKTAEHTEAVATEVKDAAAHVDQAKALVSDSKVAIAAQTNPVVSNLIDQLENPYQLSDSNIRNLIAAILQSLN